LNAENGKKRLDDTHKQTNEPTKNGMNIFGEKNNAEVVCLLACLWKTKKKMTDTCRLESGKNCILWNDCKFATLYARRLTSFMME
jgi:hypothetical protein